MRLRLRSSGPLGRMVAGGRGSTVGVGGFLLGGGISDYASRVGLSCDNVINFEVVLADGHIVNANKNTNADLFTALKGSSSWYSDTSFVDFGLNPDKDPDAALVWFQGYSTASHVDVVRAAFDYTKHVVRPAAYNEFLAVNNTISDSTKI
ncbi:hypothetical protein NX059_006584 [Plenodomus lindquistii]|nr:hypothetical protein NX059_006584 [Plenodomus lindquistii]